MEVQTRDQDGALNYYPSIKDAMAASAQDCSVWKVSWTDSETKERVRLVRTTVTTDDGHQGDLWAFEPIELPDPFGVSYVK